MFGCKNCGANMHYDIASQKLVCDYCGNSCRPEEYTGEKQAGEHVFDFESYEVTVFTCPACGGEITSTENEITGKCPFCGSENVFTSRIANEKRPRRIIPFLKTKEDCKTIYAERLKKMYYAPKELTDPSHLEGFRGIYLPYWTYDVTQKCQDLPVRAEQQSGDYIKTFDVKLNVEADYKGITFDASSTFDDSISEEIAPFHSDKSVDFVPGYLAGFYADTADIPKDLYDPDAIEFANERTKARVIEKEKANNLSISSIPGSGKDLFHSEIKSIERSLYPVWFLTWRHRDRVAYAIVNGETGKLTADIPVDPKRYLLFSLLMAVPFFILLNLFFTVTAPVTMAIGGLLAALTAWIHIRTTEVMVTRDTHEKDKGYLYIHEDSDTPYEDSVASESFVKGKKKSILSIPAGYSYILWIVLVMCLEYILDEGVLLPFTLVKFLLGSRIVVGAALTALSLPVLLKGLKLSGRQKGDSILPETLLSLLPAVIVIATLILDPVEDKYYYFSTAAALAIICLTLLTLIRRYNLRATRPIPDYHGRAERGTTAAFLLIAGLLIPFLFGPLDTRAYTGDDYVFMNEETGCGVYIFDEEDLLSDTEEGLLAGDMQPVTQYGNAVFISARSYSEDPVRYLKRTLETFYEKDSLIFFIDMEPRELHLQTVDGIKRVITNGHADSICDNVYRYAGAGKYYQCASEAFYQAGQLLEGGRIAQPMKYICNALIALILSLLFNYFLIWRAARNVPATDLEKAAVIASSVAVGRQTMKLLHTRKIVRSTGGGGIGGGGGRSGGGGGHSSGGGSHRF